MESKKPLRLKQMLISIVAILIIAGFIFFLTNITLGIITLVVGLMGIFTIFIVISRNPANPRQAAWKAASIGSIIGGTVLIILGVIVSILEQDKISQNYFEITIGFILLISGVAYYLKATKKKPSENF